ncbi:ryncolin-1-like [Crassostrea virginica]
MVVVSVEPHSQIKGDVESLLQWTSWNWRHLNTFVKVDSPVSVDVSLTSHYRLTGKHFPKFLLYLGNEAVHLLTTKNKQKLRMDVEKFTGEKAYSKYSTFSVGTKSQKYKLTIGGYNGNAGDSLAINNGMKFSTKDQDHDSDSGSCAKRFHAAWWFRAYYYANPNGMYQKTAVKSTQSVNWYHFWNEHRALKTIRFMIRLK